MLGHHCEKCSLDTESADEDDELDGDKGSDPKVHCSFNMDKIAEAFHSLSTDKEEILHKMKFGCLLKVPKKLPTSVNLMNRQFSLWLMRNVDVCFSEINLGVRGSLPIAPRDVNRVFGLPWKGEKIEPCQPEEIDKAKLMIRRILLLKDSDAMDLVTIKNLIVREYPKCMSHEHRRCFAVASVIYAASYFLAPKGRPAKIINEILPYLVGQNNICDVNWSEYVLRVLLESCSKVQNDILLEQASLTLDGCLLLLQILYLDNLEFGESRTKQYILPRVVDFGYDVLRSLIQQDTHCNTIESGAKYGKCELRHPFETIYTRGERFRALEEKMEPSSPDGTPNDDVGMFAELLSHFIENEKKNLRKQAAENVDKACASMDRCLQNLISTSDLWVEIRNKKGRQTPGAQVDGHKTYQTNYYSMRKSTEETSNGEDFYTIISPKPLEVIIEHESRCDAQPAGIQDKPVKTGRTKRMAFKSVRGARPRKILKDNTGSTQASSEAHFQSGF